MSKTLFFSEAQHGITKSWIDAHEAISKRIAHCVNLHDELVEALENLHDWTAYLVNVLPDEIQTDGATKFLGDAAAVLAKTKEMPE